MEDKFIMAKTIHSEALERKCKASFEIHVNSAVATYRNGYVLPSCSVRHVITWPSNCE